MITITAGAKTNVDCNLKNNFFKSEDIEYNSTGVGINFGKGVESFFIYEEQNKLNCQFDSCELVDLKSNGLCDTSLQGYDVKIGPGPNYQIVASDKKSEGYEKKLCLKCKLNPLWSKEETEIVNKNLEIKALPLNCSEHLKPTNFKPSPIAFGTSNEVEIGAGYKSFFFPSKKTDCKIEFCQMLSKNCLPKEFPGLKISGSPPFQIWADGQNPQGYKHEICLKCTLKESSGGQTFTTNTTIEAQKDCSKALESLDTKLVEDLDYQESGQPFSVGKGYQSFFKTHIAEGCEVEKCSLKQSNCNSEFLQSNVNVLKKSPFTIQAATNIKDGYSYRFCFECKIWDNVFKYKPLVITGWSSDHNKRKNKKCSAKITSIDS